MSNNTMVPEAQDAMNRFKMEAANEVGVNLKQGYNGDLTSKQAGSRGALLLKMFNTSYDESMKKKPLLGGAPGTGRPFLMPLWHVRRVAARNPTCAARHS